MNVAKRLRVEAADLRNRSESILAAEEHAQAIEGAADFYDDVVAREGSLVVRRGTDGRSAREYARSLAAEIRILFGVWTPGLVAETASIALTQDITAHMVRDWCASPAGCESQFC